MRYLVVVLLALAAPALAETTKVDVKILYEYRTGDGYDVGLTANGERFNFHFHAKPLNTLLTVTAMAKSRLDDAALAKTPEAIKIVKLAEAAEASRTAQEAARKIAEIQVLYPTEKLPSVVVTEATATAEVKK